MINLSTLEADDVIKERGGALRAVRRVHSRKTSVYKYVVEFQEDLLRVYTKDGHYFANTDGYLDIVEIIKKG